MNVLLFNSAADRDEGFPTGREEEEEGQVASVIIVV